MFYIIHILAGALIAKYFPSFWPIVILSLISHFIIDIIPHKDNILEGKLSKNNYEVKITKKIIMFELSEILLGLLFIIFILLKFQNTLMLLGIFFSLLPDISKIGYFTGMKHNRIFKNYMHFHSIIQTDTGWFFGILIQIIAAIILVLLLLS
jgi:hypothetical protein